MPGDVDFKGEVCHVKHAEFNKNSHSITADSDAYKKQHVQTQKKLSCIACNQSKLAYGPY